MAMLSLYLSIYKFDLHWGYTANNIKCHDSWVDMAPLWGKKLQTCHTWGMRDRMNVSTYFFVLEHA